MRTAESACPRDEDRACTPSSRPGPPADGWLGRGQIPCNRDANGRFGGTVRFPGPGHGILSAVNTPRDYESFTDSRSSADMNPGGRTPRSWACSVDHNHGTTREMTKFQADAAHECSAPAGARALLSALAGGGLTAAGLGGPLPATRSPHAGVLGHRRRATSPAPRKATGEAGATADARRRPPTHHDHHAGAPAASHPDTGTTTTAPAARARHSRPPAPTWCSSATSEHPEPALHEADRDERQGRQAEEGRRSRRAPTTSRSRRSRSPARRAGSDLASSHASAQALELLPRAAVPAADLQGGGGAVRRAVADPRGDQRNRDRLRHRPVGLERRRGRLDAVHAGDLAAVRRRRARTPATPTPTTPSTRSSPPPATCARPAPPTTCTARSSPTTTPKNTSSSVLLRAKLISTYPQRRDRDPHRPRSTAACRSPASSSPGATADDSSSRARARPRGPPRAPLTPPPAARRPRRHRRDRQPPPRPPPGPAAPPDAGGRGAGSRAERAPAAAASTSRAPPTPASWPSRTAACVSRQLREARQVRDPARRLRRRLHLRGPRQHRAHLHACRSSHAARSTSPLVAGREPARPGAAESRGDRRHPAARDAEGRSTPAARRTAAPAAGRVPERAERAKRPRRHGPGAPVRAPRQPRRAPRPSPQRAPRGRAKRAPQRLPLRTGSVVAERHGARHGAGHPRRARRAPALRDPPGRRPRHDRSRGRSSPTGPSCRRRCTRRAPSRRTRCSAPPPATCSCCRARSCSARSCRTPESRSTAAAGATSPPGAIDKRVLAVLAFLSRSGLKPTVSALRCGQSRVTVAGAPRPHYTRRRRGHHGDQRRRRSPTTRAPGTITDLTIRTLLTLPSEFVPARNPQPDAVPGVAPNTQAVPATGTTSSSSSPAASGPRLSAAAPRRRTRPGSREAARRAGSSATAAEHLAVGQLVTRIGALPAPKVALKPLPRRSRTQSTKASRPGDRPTRAARPQEVACDHEPADGASFGGHRPRRHEDPGGDRRRGPQRARLGAAPDADARAAPRTWPRRCEQALRDAAPGRRGRARRRWRASGSARPGTIERRHGHQRPQPARAGKAASRSAATLERAARLHRSSSATTCRSRPTPSSSSAPAGSISSLLGVFWGTGVGGGLILDGKPWVGRGARRRDRARGRRARRRALHVRPARLHGGLRRARGDGSARRASCVEKGRKTDLFKLMKEHGRTRLTSGIWARALEQGDKLADAHDRPRGAGARRRGRLGAERARRRRRDHRRRPRRAARPALRRSGSPRRCCRTCSPTPHPPHVHVAALGDLGGAIGASLLLELGRAGDRAGQPRLTAHGPRRAPRSG